ncbi:MAG: bacteriocin family protein, partial [Spirochaetales bacterium]|nr:bacteriocin family protein [Spirochaetales bacterium]
MDFFKREIAPLTKRAWDEVEARAREVLLSRLSARRVVHINGPKGIDHTVISEGRLTVVDDGEVKSGVYAVKPLTEARIRFTLNKWELDNLERGAKDIDFDAMDSALEQLALFEEKAIYDGYAAGNIKGLKQSSAHKPLSFGGDSEAILGAVSQGLLLLKGAHIHGPYSLVVGKDAWVKLNQQSHPMSLFDRVEKLIDEKIILSSCL